MYPYQDTILQLLPVPDVLLQMSKGKSRYRTKHLMSGPSGKQNKLFPSGPYIKCIMSQVDEPQDIPFG